MSKATEQASEYENSDAAQVVARQYEIVEAPFTPFKAFQAHLDGQRVGHFAGAKALLEWAKVCAGPDPDTEERCFLEQLEAYFAEQAK